MPTLTMTVDGATVDVLARSVEAARSVFVSANVTPQQAAQAAFDIEGWDVAQQLDPKHRPSPAAFAAAEAWWDAREVAMSACSNSWATVPADQPGLELRD